MTLHDGLFATEPVRSEGGGFILPPLGNRFVALRKVDNPARHSDLRSTERIDPVCANFIDPE